MVTTSPLHDELKELGKRCITKMCANHYNGMAFNQQRRMQINDVKKLLHAYRCLLMGIHLMISGDLVMDIPALAREYDQYQIPDIIKDKLSGVDGLDADEMARHTRILDLLHERLDYEQSISQLPDKPTSETRQALEELLIRVRMETR